MMVQVTLTLKDGQVVLPPLKYEQNPYKKAYDFAIATAKEMRVILDEDEVHNVEYKTI